MQKRYQRHSTTPVAQVLTQYCQDNATTYKALAEKTGVNASYFTHAAKQNRISPKVAKRVEAATNGAISAATLMSASSPKRTGRPSLKQKVDVSPLAKLLGTMMANPNQPIPVTKNDLAPATFTYNP